VTRILRSTGRVTAAIGLSCVIAFAWLFGPAAAAANAAETQATKDPTMQRDVDETFKGIPATDPSNPVLLTGQFTKDDTGPIVGAVYVIEWPNEAVKRSLEKGDKVPVQPLTWAATDDQGRFAVYAETAALQEHHGDESIEFELRVVSREGEVFRTFIERAIGHDGTYWTVPTTSSTEAEFVRTGYGPMGSKERAQAAAKAVVGNVKDGENQAELSKRYTDAYYAGLMVQLTPEQLDEYRAGLIREARGFRAKDGMPVPVDDPDATFPVTDRHHAIIYWSALGKWIGVCTGYENVGNSAPLPTMTLELQTTKSHSGVGTYTNSAQSTISRGLGINDPWGPVLSFSMDGTKTQTGGFSGTLSTQTGTAHTDRLINWVHYQYEDHCAPSGMAPPVANYIYRRTEPGYVSGGSSTRGSWYGDIGTSYCQFWAGPTVTRTTGTATTYSSAFNITWGFLNLWGNSKAGFNSQVTLSYTFETNSGDWWCGHNDYPGVASRVRTK
jgi:hypothetical protein